MMHDYEVLYKLKATLCNQHATILEVNEDSKAQGIMEIMSTSVTNSQIVVIVSWLEHTRYFMDLSLTQYIFFRINRLDHGSAINIQL